MQGLSRLVEHLVAVLQNGEVVPLLFDAIQPTLQGAARRSPSPSLSIGDQVCVLTRIALLHGHVLGTLFTVPTPTL